MKISPQRIIALLVVVGVVFAIVRAFLPQPVSVDFGEVTRGPMRVTVNEDGVTRIKERYVVSSPLAGRLRRVELKAGDVVRKGETVVAVIEPGDPQLLDARGRAGAGALVKAAEAAVQRAKAEVERAVAAHDLAVSELKRARELFDSGVASRLELELAETAARTAAGELKAGEFTAEIAQFEVEQARAALLQYDPGAGENDAVIEIRSPIDGRVLRVWQESSAVIGTGTPLLELGDPSDLEIVVDVLSAEAVQINPGAKIFLEHWGGSKSLNARVRLVEPSAFLKVSALGVEEQRVNVIGDLESITEGSFTLGDAFRVEARIVVWETDNALQVPAAALFRRGEQWAVFVVVEDRARLREVVIAHQNGEDAEVLEGLEPGEQIILYPGDQIESGAAVEPR